MNGAIIFNTSDNNGTEGFRPMEFYNGVSALRHQVILLKTANISPIILLTNQRLSAESHLARMGVICLGEEGRGEENMAPYFKQALSILEKTSNKIVISTTDTVFYRRETLDALLNSSYTPVRPIYGEDIGFPMVIAFDDVYSEVGKLYDLGTIPEVIALLSQHMEGINVNDEGCVIRISDGSDYRAIKKSSQINRLRTFSKFTIAKEQVFFGPGTYQLLSAIAQIGSVRKACTLIGISYSKGWKIIKLAEEEMSFSIVERRKGGDKGGYAKLTIKGEELMKVYESYVKACTKAVDDVFVQYFARYQEEENGIKSGESESH